jgi:hypothetical protein
VILFGVGATRAGLPTGSSPTPSTPAASPPVCRNTCRKKLWTAGKEAAAAGDVTSKTPKQRAATTLVAAVASEFATTGGHYLDDGNEVPVIANDADTGLMAQGVRAWAVDPDTARRLWDISLDLTGGVRR